MSKNTSLFILPVFLILLSHGMAEEGKGKEKLKLEPGRYSLRTTLFTKPGVGDIHISRVAVTVEGNKIHMAMFRPESGPFSLKGVVESSRIWLGGTSFRTDRVFSARAMAASRFFSVSPMYFDTDAERSMATIDRSRPAA